MINKADFTFTLLYFTPFLYLQVIDASTIYVAVRKSSRDGLVQVPFVAATLIATDTPVTTDNFNVHDVGIGIIMCLFMICNKFLWFNSNNKWNSNEKVIVVVIVIV